MKKKSLISLSSLFLASALLVGCGSKTNEQQVESEEEPQVVEPSDNNHHDDNQGGKSNGVEKCHIHIDLHGTTLKEQSTKQTDFVTRSGTLWNLLSNLAPSKDDIMIPGTEQEGVTYNIKSIAYSFDKEGEDVITPSTPIRSDTNLFLQIEHDDSETGVQVSWQNDVGEPGGLGVEKYAIGEIPFYAGPTPKSAQDPSKTFVGWLPAVSPIKVGDVDRIYVAQYEKIGVECLVTYDYNYKIGESEVVDYRYVKQGETAQPLDPKPVRKNYIFDYWCKDKECTTQFDFEHTIITDDLTRIYAKWIPELEQLKIDPNGGTFNDDKTEVKTFDSTYGKTWNEVKTNHPEILIKAAPEGYNLDGYKYQYYDVMNANWVDLTDDFIITKNLSIKVVYAPIQATLSFTDDYDSGATFPDSLTIDYGTKWLEIKNDCMPTGAKDGYTFDHYYIDDGQGHITDINDNYVFNFANDATVTLHACWSVVIHFETDTTIGIVDYTMARLLTGTKWGDIKSTYEPHVIDPTVYQFKNYTTDPDSTVVGEDYIISKPSNFVAQYEGTKANSFANDSWDVFTSYVGSCTTYEQMTATGAPYQDEYASTQGGKEANTFVGLTRTIKIFGKDYTVRVIDDGKTGSTTRAHSHFFTFEFTNLLDLEVPYSLNANNNNYDDSFINSYLNNSFLYQLPTALQNAIGTTSVKYFDTTSGSVKEDLSTKLFILSASELNFDKYPDYGEDVVDEGSYAYYQLATASTQKALLSAPTTYVDYWTRSADISGTDEYAWNVNGDGTLGTSNYSILVNSGSTYIAPAFEI